ncbi:hypothetical protein TRFO_43046 [Tritrichomonas foetus]|uniref:Uncharacterized protein n=1 Tax=Tritrichomonas foetus TaxID=1144522 RepID=A0A1J4KT36_9EUKA|nr:hypothetical protein TRFO_43046 [Tritrichomonas foetus]|eukprot:OHT14455.1 hypothetical protein TRFO_43046 [Tritrichomonas foetus]
MVLPKKDFQLINGVCNLKELEELDIEIRKGISKAVNCPELPISFFYTPKLKGGLGLTKLTDCFHIFNIKSFMLMKESEDANIKSSFEINKKEEIKYRKIINENENENDKNIFGIHIQDKKIIQAAKAKGTSCTMIKAALSGHKLKININQNRIDGTQ